MRLLILALLLVGCVPKKKYDELDAQLQATNGKLSSEQARSRGLQEQLTAEQAKSAGLQSQLADTLRDKMATDASVAQMQAALQELAARKSAADARIAEFRDLMAKFKALIDSGRLKVKIVAGRMVVEMATDILFSSGSASLSKEGRAALADVATVLASIPDREFQIEGHTDNVPIATDRFPSNWELASARAVTVVNTLKDGGVDVGKLSAASYAENRPVDTNKTTEGKAANRRIQIVVVPDLSQLPGYEDLEKLTQ